MTTNEPAISVRGLRKTYRRRDLSQIVAVEGLDLDVPAGGVHGFLGPNGSGKTTTIRMLLGLARPDAGSMHVFGVPVPQRLPEVIGRIGAIVEQPRFVPTFSGRRNLEVLAVGIGAPSSRVDDVLDRVALRERDRDPFRRYSLGMKQRLAIAAALLKEPDLLIFDEPTNGLDPAGIHDVRATMRSLADEGRTVLVSSHLLSEVEQIADTVSIVARGRLLAAGPVSALVAGAGQVRVAVADREAASRVIAAHGWQASDVGDALVVAGAPGAAHVNEALGRAQIFPQEVRDVRPDLESVFLQLTGGPAPGAPGAAPVDGVRS